MTDVSVPEHPLAARYYADHATFHAADLVCNEQVAHDTYRLRFTSPEIASRILPGQFLMMRLAACDDPLVGRALALYDTAPNEGGRPTHVDVVYAVEGKFTTRLARLSPGAGVLEVWGPLGNGFRPQPREHLIMVGGGIGFTPFLAVAAQHLGERGYGGDAPVRHAQRVTFCYGVRSAAAAACVEDFQRLGVTVALATEDGSAGHAGLVTELLERILDQETATAHIVCCGPVVMMRKVAAIAAQRGLSCEVSLEAPMACGIGICFSCVAKVRQSTGEWDYKRTCVEGPVFAAAALDWSQGTANGPELTDPSGTCGS